MAEQSLKNVLNDDHCFVCGSDNPIGLKVQFTTDAETLTSQARVTLEAPFQGWQDIVHGGILATLLDEACAYACRSRVEQCVTGEITVRYRKPVPVGATVEITGQVIDSSHRVWRAEAQLKIDGTLHAEAGAKMVILAPA